MTRGGGPGIVLSQTAGYVCVSFWGLVSFACVEHGLLFSRRCRDRVDRGDGRLEFERITDRNDAESFRHLTAVRCSLQSAGGQVKRECGCALGLARAAITAARAELLMSNPYYGIESYRTTRAYRVASDIYSNYMLVKSVHGIVSRTVCGHVRPLALPRSRHGARSARSDLERPTRR